MSNRFLFLPILCLVAALAGCKKDRSHTSAEGVVIDATTQARVAGARVYLLQTKGTSLYASPSRVQHVEADNLGKFSLSFEAEDDSRYDLQATASTFFDTPNGEYTGLVKGEKNKKNVTVRPEAWLRVRLVSTALPNAALVSWQDPTPDGQPHYFSSPVDTVIVVRCKGNQNALVGAVLNPNSGSPQVINQDIYCPAHDTTDFTIRF